MIYCESKPYQNADDPNVHHVFRGRQHVHLMADTEEELIEYAISIGLDSRWIQDKGTIRVHFDCVGKFMNIVIKDIRVEKLDREDFVKKYLNKRKEQA